MVRAALWPVSPVRKKSSMTLKPRPCLSFEIAIAKTLFTALIVLTSHKGTNAFGIPASRALPSLGREKALPNTYRRMGSNSVNDSNSVVGDVKADFLECLDLPYDLNLSDEKRSRVLKEMVDQGSLPGGGSLENPGRLETFALVAPGLWRVVYAPHMTTMSGLLGGKFSVEYDLRPDGSMTSHAKYSFPLLNLWGYLSVSGTYGPVSDTVCKVDFDEAWLRILSEDSIGDGPTPDIDSVPESFQKTLIRNIGRAVFIDAFAVFPISYLDRDLIVFDFELLGTRICSRKEATRPNKRE